VSRVSRNGIVSRVCRVGRVSTISRVSRLSRFGRVRRVGKVSRVSRSLHPHPLNWPPQNALPMLRGTTPCSLYCHLSACAG
jgi:hypothetical protein